MQEVTSDNVVTAKQLFSYTQTVKRYVDGKVDNLEDEKADKVENATAGNFASLDDNGNLTDSGKTVTDFATAEQGRKADSAVQGVKVNGTELSKDGNNKVDVPVPTASTATPLKDGTASAGSDTQWARGDHRHPTDDSREAVSNKVQSINDESETDYPSSKAVAEFVNSSVATNTATFLGNFKLVDLGLTYPATEVQIAAALNSHTWPTGYPTNNDYVYVEIRNPQSTIDNKVQRYKYRDVLASWGYEFTLNNSSFTAAEKAAIDSGITSQDVTNLRADHTTLGTHVADTTNPHNVTKLQVGLGNVDNTSDADKPISTAQQTALNAKADNTPTFTEASTRANLIGSGETMPTILGKIKKWFTDFGALAFKDTLSSFNYESIGNSAVDLNNLLYANECHAYVWTYANRNNVANKPSNNGSVLLSYGFYSTTYGVQIVMDGNDYEKPLYIRFKAANQWKDWIPFRDASWINSGTFGTDRIADDAITAAKVKDNETLPVNVSGKSGALSAPTPLMFGNKTGYMLLATIDFATTDSLYAGVSGEFFIRHNDGFTGSGTFAISFGEYGTSVIQGNVCINYLRMYGTIRNKVRLGAVKKSSTSFEIWGWRSGYSFPWVNISAPAGSNITFPSVETVQEEAPTGWTEIPYMYNVAKNTFSPVGSTTTPVYADTDGSVKECDPSQMTVAYTNHGRVADFGTLLAAIKAGPLVSHGAFIISSSYTLNGVTIKANTWYTYRWTVTANDSNYGILDIATGTGYATTYLERFMLLVDSGTEKILWQIPSTAGFGTAGQYLKSNGANNAPRWENVTTLSPTVAVNDFNNFNATVNTTNIVNSNAGSSSSNAPKSDSRKFNVITTIGSSAQNQTQLAIGIDENRHAGLFYRCRAAGSWQPWMQVVCERPSYINKGNANIGIYIDSYGHPVACSYGISIGTAVADSSILTVL